MTMIRFVPPLLATAMILALAPTNTGCQTNKHRETNSERAHKRWGAARAAVLGSLAKGQLEAGHFDKSRETLDQAKQLDPENAGLLVLSGKLALEQGQLEVADRELTSARYLDPNLAEADYLSGVVYQRWHKPEVAYDLYTSAAEKDSKEEAYELARAEMLVVLGRQDEALTLLQQRLAAFPNSAIFHDTIGQLFLTQGRYPQAVESLRQASILKSDDLYIREHLAMAMFYNGQHREAAEQFSRLVKDKSYASRADLFVVMGECQMNLGRHREARQSFDAACDINPESHQAWLSTAKVSLQLNDLRRAESSLRRAMTLAPDQAEVHLMLGYIRLREQKLADALEAFRQASTLDRSDSLSLCMIGYVLEKSGRREQAIQYYDKALKLNPNDELATHLMASVETSER